MAIDTEIVALTQKFQSLVINASGRELFILTSDKRIVTLANNAEIEKEIDDAVSKTFVSPVGDKDLFVPIYIHPSEVQDNTFIRRMNALGKVIIVKKKLIPFLSKKISVAFAASGGSKQYPHTSSIHMLVESSGSGTSL